MVNRVLHAPPLAAQIGEGRNDHSNQYGTPPSARSRADQQRSRAHPRTMRTSTPPSARPSNPPSTHPYRLHDRLRLRRTPHPIRRIRRAETTARHENGRNLQHATLVTNRPPTTTFHAPDITALQETRHARQARREQGTSSPTAGQQKGTRGTADSYAVSVSVWVLVPRHERGTVGRRRPRPVLPGSPVAGLPFTGIFRPHQQRDGRDGTSVEHGHGLPPATGRGRQPVGAVAAAPGAATCRQSHDTCGCPRHAEPRGSALWRLM